MKEKKSLTLSSEAFNWCVKNDFQVYIVPTYDRGRSEYRIAVRHRGITTEGKDYIYNNGVRIQSKETIGKEIFSNAKDASEHYNYVIEGLMKKYG